MTDSDLTAIQLVIDRSGSMSSIYEDAEGAVNSFIDKQKAEPGRALIRVTQFDHEVDVVYGLSDIQECEKFVLEPRGMTALYDAMGTSVLELGKELADMDEDMRPGKVIFVTVTDGMENRSQDFTSERLKELITEQTDKYGWTFLFLAAGQDAVLTGSEIGIRPNHSMSYAATGKAYGATMDSVSYAASSLRSGITYRGFTDEDRKKAGGDS